MKEQAQFHVSYWFIAVLAFLGIQYLLTAQQEVATIPYSEFEQLGASMSWRSPSDVSKALQGAVAQRAATLRQ